MDTRVAEGSVVFVESPATGTGNYLISGAVALGLRPVVFARDPDAYDFEEHEGLVARRQVDTEDFDAVLAAARQVSDLRGLCSAFEYYAHVSARVARALGLPGADPAAVERCRSKYLTRQRLAARAPHLTPDHVLVQDTDGIDAVCDRLGFPVVLKLLDSAGGGGIVMAHSRDQAREGAAYLLSLDAYGGRKTARDIIAERYLAGPEYSVETLGLQVLAITEKVKGGVNDLTEIGHEIPAQLDPATETAMGAAVVEALKAVGLTFGAAHTEVIVTDKGPMIVEINARMAGDFVPYLVELATGFPYARAYVSALCGLPDPDWTSRQSAAVIRFSLLDRTAEVRAVDGIERARAIDSIVGAGSIARLGKVYTYYGNNRNRLGWAIAVDRDAARARAASDRAVAAMAFELRDVPG